MDLKPFYKRVRFWLPFLAVLAVLVLAPILQYQKGLRGYLSIQPDYRSLIADSLAVFDYNQSQHKDLVPGCWYDSGDYIVFLHRNAQALFYLSLAYRESENEYVKQDLESLIRKQLKCAESMAESSIKQFRDQDSHGTNLPPSLNQMSYPSRTYFFEEGEGGDVFLMLSFVYLNLKQKDKALLYAKKAEGLSSTASSNCCELGMLALTKDQWNALQGLGGKSITSPEEIWGSQFTSLLALQERNFAKIEGLLNFLDEQWKGGPEPFVYLGGNYDIAGSIMLERMYAHETGDHSYKRLSDELYAYLKGENEHSFDFTQSHYIYHPCHFFSICQLKNVLINGIYKEGQREIERNWQTAEVQLVGQAQYVLARVLYENW